MLKELYDPVKHPMIVDRYMEIKQSKDLRFISEVGFMSAMCDAHLSGEKIYLIKNAPKPKGRIPMFIYLEDEKELEDEN